MRKWLRFGVVGLLCGSLLGLTACGDDDDSEGDTTVDAGVGRDATVDASPGAGRDASQVMGGGTDAGGGDAGAAGDAACRRDGGQPVAMPPSGFSECGDGLGYCITAVPETAMLSQLSCMAGEVCAPKLQVTDPSACPARCDSIGGYGGCIPGFVIPMENRGFLPQGSCKTGEVCAPCKNPLDQMSTGLCD